TFTRYENPIGLAVIDDSPDNMKVGDYNGDGMSDVYFHWGIWGMNRLFLSNGDGTFTRYDNPIGEAVIDDSPDNMKVGDYDGDGLSDVYFHWKGSGTNLLFLSGPKPEVLTSLSNGLGGTTTLEYRPSSKYENTLLPFIVQTVSSITTDDGLGVRAGENPSTTNYTYSGGLYDYGDREFRGFEYATQTNPDGTTVKTTFHQDEYFKGRQDEVEASEPGDPGTLLSKTTMSWDKTFLDAPENTCAFVKLTQTRTETYDSQTVYSQQDYTYYDNNGFIHTIEAKGTDADSTNDIINTTHTYTNCDSPNGWVWRVQQVEVEGRKTLTSRGTIRTTTHGYDESHHDWNAPENRGNRTSTEYWCEGCATDPKVWMTYDIYGNLEKLYDANGNLPTEYQYEATKTYPSIITNPKGHVIEKGWNLQFGLENWVEDENDKRTNNTYDEMGRLIQVDSPDSGQQIIEYHDWEVEPTVPEFPRYVVTKVKEDASNTIDSYKYFDGLGRSITGVTFGQNSKIVTKTKYDDMGRVVRTEGPFFSTDTLGYNMT
ncbi:MAG: toxin TcdB middle/N-terminal domain-containing protein, partial [Thermodesulfobacteriota bacterium]|nr:toxin TcdB middle/N-terminal domain-containing protein [Thermodesulfobacteriota bacterium]